jgi:hypothetical protein
MGVVTCRDCGLRYFEERTAACPRCAARGATPPATTAAAASTVEPALVDEARTRLLVWNDERSEVEQKLVARGVPEEEAQRLVAALAREIAARRAGGARFGGAVFVAIGSAGLLLGAGLLWIYETGLEQAVESGEGWRPNFFTGSLLVGGAALAIAGGATLLRGLARIVSGRAPPP